MSKKFLAVLALAAASLFAFVGCSGEDYSFTALENNPSAEAAVRSNGGVYVEKGDYSYFINGAQDGTGNNTFGTEHKGALVRCLTADLTKSDRKVEVVVPKILYAGDVNSSGFYIFGDTIYYTTPNSTKDASGNVQYTKLDFMSVNLDGTGTKLIATMEDNTKAFQFVQTADGGVYIFYEGTAQVERNGETTDVTALYEVNAETGETKLIASDVASYAFDRSGNGDSVAYTVTQYKTSSSTGTETAETKYNVLYSYTAGDDEPFEVASGVTEENEIEMRFMTVRYISGDKIYYTYTSKYLGEIGIAKATVGAKTTAADTLAQTDSEYSGFIPAAGEDAIYIHLNGYIRKITFADGKISQNKILLSNSSEITLEKVVSDGNEEYLYYSLEGVLYRVNTSDVNQEAAQVIDGTMASTWTTFDYTVTGEGENAAVAVIYFNDSESNTFVNYLFMDVYAKDAAGEYDISSKRIGKLTTRDTETAVANGKDDSAGVDALPSDSDN